MFLRLDDISCIIALGARNNDRLRLSITVFPWPHKSGSKVVYGGIIVWHEFESFAAIIGIEG